MFLTTLNLYLYDVHVVREAIFTYLDNVSNNLYLDYVSDNL